MIKIAIKGHPVRWKKVIQILKNLGGNDTYITFGCNPNSYYYINVNNNITYTPISKLKCSEYKDFKLYTLEEFEKEFPFKVGDKVITTDGTIGIIDRFEPEEEHPYCIKANVGGFYWCVTSILKPYKEMKKERNITLTLEKAKEWYNKGGELREIALQAFNIKELTVYPKTYEECCGIMDFCSDTLKWDNPFCINRDTHPYIKHLDNLIESFCKLLICRDAYWKIAGEEMELGKPWEPDWTNNNEVKFNIGVSENEIIKCHNGIAQYILAFPTEEMRDAFYENFKDEIEQCKELL